MTDPETYAADCRHCGHHNHWTETTVPGDDGYDIVLSADVHTGEPLPVRRIPHRDDEKTTS